MTSTAETGTSESCTDRQVHFERFHRIAAGSLHPLRSRGLNRAKIGGLFTIPLPQTLPSVEECDLEQSAGNRA